ncbi:MAG: rhomboid family intramembrane serine protease [Planctomycetes bacterium]|nr:rhomboid family intramembrane serine protease [Planctomycetota bacterium]
MRLIGHIQDETRAQRFGDYLYSEGIESQIDEGKSGDWEIWILDDHNLDSAKELLTGFNEQPEDPRYATGARGAVASRKRQEKAQPKSRSRFIDGRTMFHKPAVPYGPLTIALIVVSVAVTWTTRMGANRPLTSKLQITESRVQGGYMTLNNELAEIRQGQVWRIFTPMFLHFGIMHIIFNMLWLKDLGSIIEAHKGTWLLLALVLTIAGLSNVAQFLHNGPSFGGMSGVVFGLLGYIWMQGKFNPASQLHLQQQTVTFMIIWFFVCLTGLVGPVANMAHGAGAVVGILWGFLAAKLHPSR